MFLSYLVHKRMMVNEASRRKERNTNITDSYDIYYNFFFFFFFEKKEMGGVPTPF